jgi:hypothetical protein
MAGIFNGPPRGGTRGGRAEFSWDSVKADESREYYLGHSVKAVTGRWQKNKDVFWYTRDKEDGESADIRREKEMAMVKQREQDLMMEALGMKPKAPRHADAQEQLDGRGMPPYDKNAAAAGAALPPQSTLDQAERHRHHQSRKEREEKKAAKRAKKEARREKKRSKDSKRRRRSRSRSSSPTGGGKERKEYSDSSDSEDSRDRKHRSRNRRRSRSRSPIEQHRERRRRD